MLAILTLCAALAQDAAPQFDDPGELADALLDTWDRAGLQVDATWSHTLLYVGPRYMLHTRHGVYLDATAGLGATARQDRVKGNGTEAPWLFGRASAMAGFSLLHGITDKGELFEWYQKGPAPPPGSKKRTLVYHPLEGMRISDRNFIVSGGIRTILGHGPDLDNTGQSGPIEVAPGYFSIAVGLAYKNFWSEIHTYDGVRYLFSGISGTELFLLYTPQNSSSYNFSKWRHVGFELRGIGSASDYEWPFHLALGIEPGLGPFIKIGMTVPLAAPLSPGGPAASARRISPKRD